MLDKAASIVSRKGGTQASFVLSGNGTTQNGTIYIKGNKFYIDTKDAKMWYNGALIEQLIPSREPVGGLGVCEGTLHDMLYLGLVGGGDDALAHHTGNGGGHISGGTDHGKQLMEQQTAVERGEGGLLAVSF